MDNKIGTKEQRKVRIGGSEFATVLDINPFQKRIDLILDKAGVVINTFEGNEATRRGQLLEGEVIQLFEKETGLKVSNQQEEFQYVPNYGLPLVCHVDGITSDNAVFEAKTTDIKSKTWANGIPEYYQAQLEFNCYLSKRQKAYIAVAFCDDVKIVNFKWFEYIPKMKNELILLECNRFSSEVEYYKKLGVINSGRVENATIDNSLIDEYFILKQKIDALKLELAPLEEKKKYIEGLLKEKIGNNAGIENELYRITLGNRVTSPKSTYSIVRSGIKIELKGK